MRYMKKISLLLVTLLVTFTFLMGGIGKKVSELVSNHDSQISLTSNQLDYATDLDILIKEDLANVSTKQTTFTGSYTFFQYRKQRNRNWLGNLGSEFGNRILSEGVNQGIRNINWKITSTNDNKQTINQFYYDWTGDELNINGSWTLDSWNTQYPSINFAGSKRTFIQATIPNIKTNIDGSSNDDTKKVEINNKFSGFSYVTLSDIFNSNDAQVIMQMIEKGMNSAYWAANQAKWTTYEQWNTPASSSSVYPTTGFGSTFVQAYQVAKDRQGLRLWTEPNGITDDTKILLQDYLRDIGAIKFNHSLLNNLFDIDLAQLKESNNQKVWSSSTIKDNTKNVMKFSKYMWWLKTLAYAYEILEKINQEVIFPYTGKSIDFTQIKINEVNDFLNSTGNYKDSGWGELTADWRDNSIYSKNITNSLIQEILQLKFPDYDELRSKTNQYFLLDNHPFSGFNRADGDFSTVLDELVKIFDDNLQNKTLLNQPLYFWYKLYQGLLYLLKKYDLVCYAKVYSGANSEYVQTTIDGMDYNKTITLWDSSQGWFNYNFINEIGEKYIDRNVLEFSLEDFSFSHDDNQYNNSVFIEKNTDWTMNEFNTKQLKTIVLSYRYNAVPIDKLVLSYFYDQSSSYTHFNVSTRKTINQLVYLNDEVEEVRDELGNVIEKQHYINDIIEYNDGFSVRKLILEAINSALVGYVVYTSGYSGMRFNLFDEVICGIGIGDLNQYFAFDQKNSFFDNTSWKDALSRFKIRTDNQNDHYPIYAADYYNNTIYVIATIPNWIFADGTHGDYEAVWTDIVNNRVKWKKEGNNYIDYDYRFYTMSEIEPRTRINEDGSYNNKGYFLVKLNVGGSHNTWSPNHEVINDYYVSNWDEVEDSLIKPVDANASNPWLNAGIMQFVMSKKEDGSPQFWVNNKKLIVNKGFFRTETYEINDWKLDSQLVLKALEMQSIVSDRYFNFRQDIINWINYVSKLDNKTKEALVDSIVSVDDPLDVKGQAIQWYLQNAMLDIQIQNYKFISYYTLQNDYLFNQILAFYGVDFWDIFEKKSVFVCGEKTNGYEIAIKQKALGSKMSNDNFSRRLKVIKGSDHNLYFANKSNWVNGNNTFANFRLPSNFVYQLIENYTFNKPKQWDNFDYNKYNQSPFMLHSLNHAMTIIKGMTLNLPVYTNYRYNYLGEYEIIKQNLMVQTNVINILVVALGPICLLIIVGGVIMLGLIISKKRI